VCLSIRNTEKNKANVLSDYKLHVTSYSNFKYIVVGALSINQLLNVCNDLLARFYLDCQLHFEFICLNHLLEQASEYHQGSESNS
jgi:hypothetical protein